MLEKKDLVIALDGPAASGKSTLASKLSKELNIVYVSTGSLYRAVAWAMLKENYSEITKDFLSTLKLQYIQSGDNSEVIVNGFSPKDELRTPEVASKASAIATIPMVREFLLDLQRSFAGEKLIVMEGRDIGSIIFPNAKYKFFVTASVEVRAKRRLAQSNEVANGETLESLMQEISKRDLQDSNRKTAPLRQTDDAIFIDSSNMTVEEIIQKILSYIEKEDIA